MTYDLTIGQYIEEPPDEDGYIYRGVNLTELSDAPALPGSLMSRHCNRISIPWGGYREMVNAFATYDEELAALLFTGSNDSVNIQLTPCLVARIRQMVATYRANHPDAIPGFEGEHDWVLARMIVLEWWANYSLRTYGANAAVHIS